MLGTFLSIYDIQTISPNKQHCLMSFYIFDYVGLHEDAAFNQKCFCWADNILKVSCSLGIKETKYALYNKLRIRSSKEDKQYTKGI